MKKINKPDLDSECIFKECVESFRNSSLFSKDELIKMKTDIKKSHNEYDQKGNISELNTFEENNILLSYARLDDFEKLYDSALSNKSKVKVYSYYNKIKAWSNNGYEQRCAFCGINRVTELDHFLPKSRFKTLAIEPLNLLPICRDCNKEKGDFYSPDLGLIHPYFDDIQKNWFYIHFYMKKGKLLISFTIENRDSIPSEFFERIKKTAEQLKILEIYNINLIDDCIDLRSRFEEYLNIEECLIFIRSEIKRFQKEMNINHPKRRLYECIIDYIQLFGDINLLLKDD